jgi:hypothetical protein
MPPKPALNLTRTRPRGNFAAAVPMTSSTPGRIRVEWRASSDDDTWPLRNKLPIYSLNVIHYSAERGVGW